MDSIKATLRGMEAEFAERLGRERMEVLRETLADLRDVLLAVA